MTMKQSDSERIFEPEPEPTTPPVHPDEGQALIIGPSKCGKTSLLGALRLQALLSAAEAHRPRHKIVADDGEDGERFRKLSDNLVTAALKDGRFGAEPSQDVSAYRFALQTRMTERVDVEVPADVADASLWGRMSGRTIKRKKTVATSREVTRSVPFVMSDGPGGDVFVQDRVRDDSKWKNLLQRGQNSFGLIMCVDSNNVAIHRVFFAQLSSVLEALADNARRPTALKRFVIVLTKADIYFSRFGTEASDEACRADPWQRLRQLIGDAGWGSVRMYVDPEKTEMACGWASAYGFIPRDGSANFIPDEGGETGRFRIFNAEHAELTDWNLWKPFRVLEPFAFVATGELENLTRYPG